MLADDTILSVVRLCFCNHYPRSACVLVSDRYVLFVPNLSRHEHQVIVELVELTWRAGRLMFCMVLI